MTETIERSPVVYARGQGVVANSRDVADYFGKQHKDVLRSIDGMVEIEPELQRRNFAPLQILVPTGKGGRRLIRSFDMDRDGFSLLAMGFTGREALRWKLRYIGAFNAMEAALRQPETERDNLPSSADSKVFGLSVAKVNSIARIVSVANAIYGPEAARSLWEAEPGLPRLNHKAVGALAGTAQDDPVGCFRHLMRAAAGNGQTLGQKLSLAIRDRLAGRAMKNFGIAVDPAGAPGMIGFANAHPFLAAHFAETPWCGDWRIALTQLPGARSSASAITFGDIRSKAVLISRGEVLGLLNPAAGLN